MAGKPLIPRHEHRLAPVQTALIAVTALLAGAFSTSVHGSTASPAPAPTRHTTTLPDWSGEWEFADAQPDATGGMAQSLEELMESVKSWGPSPVFRPGPAAKLQEIHTFLQESNAAIHAGQALPADPQLRAMCLFGMPSLMIFSPLMFEIVTAPKETIMVFSDHESRHVYTDGRRHTPADDYGPTYWGDSVGHWEQQTLVIDTTGIAGFGIPDTPDVPLEIRGATVVAVFGGAANDAYVLGFMSTRSRLQERIRMLDQDHLENRITIIDPLLLEQPWHIRRVYRRVHSVNRMEHEDCQGEDRNPVVNGQYTLAPPPQPLMPPPPAAAPSKE